MLRIVVSCRDGEKLQCIVARRRSKIFPYCCIVHTGGDHSILSTSPVAEQCLVRVFEKTIAEHRNPAISCRSCLPGWTFAGRRSVSGMSHGQSKSGGVISSDTILKWKRI